MKVNLSKVSTKELNDELQRRADLQNQKDLVKNVKRVKKLFDGKNVELAASYTRFDDYHDYPVYSFGAMVDGDFIEFYYQSGLEFEDWSSCIPDDFSQLCENCYEYDGTMEETIDTLKKCGYTYFEDITEE